MFENFFTKIWYCKTLPCRTSLKSCTAAAVPAEPAAPPMLVGGTTTDVSHSTHIAWLRHENLGWGSLKVIENYPIQSGTHDFLLTFHSNHRPISHRLRDKMWCTSKIERKSPIFPPTVYLTPPVKGFPVEFGIGVRGLQCLNDVPTRRSKKFSDRFSHFHTIPSVTDSHPASHVAVSITLNAKASSLKTNRPI